MKILGIAGSARKESLNAKLLRVGAGMAREAGAEVEILDINALELPIYNGDLESASGLPPGAKVLKQKIAAADGLLIASPEYNGMITPLLKNLLDWASRKESPEEAPLSVYRGKVAALLAASPGPLGGVRVLPSVRILLSNLGVLVVPTQFGIGFAEKAFDAEGRLVDEKQRAAVKGVVGALLSTTKTRP